MEFKGPKSYKPSFGQPSPSRKEILRDELGFEADSDAGSTGTSDEEPEVDQLSNNITLVQIQSLQLEIEQKDKQREEMLLKLKALSEKTASYKARLTKSEQNKKSQMKIMKKTHEVLVEEKDKLIADLQEIISDQEKRLTEQEGKTKKKGKGNKGSSTGNSGLQQLVETITRLHEDKAKHTEALVTAQSELETVKDEARNAAAKHRSEIEDFRLEIKKLKSITKQANDDKKENINTNVSTDISRLEDENKALRHEKKNLETQLWQTQQNLRDEIRKLEEEVRSTSKKLRDAESKYVNLAATPPKVQVRTVSVVSEEMRKRLDQLIDQNRELEDSLTQTKMEHNAKVSSMESELSTTKSECRSLQDEKKCLSFERDKLLQAAKQSSEIEHLLKRTENALEEATTKVLELETKLDFERRAHKQEVETILREKDAAIEEVKMEAEKTTVGVRNLYDSLKANCVHLLEATKQLRFDYKQLKTANLKHSSCIAPLLRDIHKQIVREIKGVDEKNKELVKRYIKEMKLRKKLHNELVDLKGNIRVYCRVRPLIVEDGGGASAANVISFDMNDDGIVTVDNKGTTKTFEMEKVFPPTSSQEQVFSEVKNLIISCLDGYNVCIFAYGQTGSGKTYTMEGPSENPGLNQRALQLLFKTIKERSKDWDYTVTVSVLEIYNENIRDLLSSKNQKLEIKMGNEGFHVPGLTNVRVHDIDDVNELFAMGKENRATATTNMNEHSSRSHAILRITLMGKHNATQSTITAKLNLVDLAGSERVGKSGSEGLRMKEAQNINKSLSSLGDVINALKNKQSHIPYRNSKLTFLLQDSLGGDSKTLMVVQVSPVMKNVGETICSLTFAQRVRMVELGQATKNVETFEDKPSTPNKQKQNNVARRR